MNEYKKEIESLKFDILLLKMSAIASIIMLFLMSVTLSEMTDKINSLTIP